MDLEETPTVLPIDLVCSLMAHSLARSPTQRKGQGYSAHIALRRCEIECRRLRRRLRSGL
jgi:hypothetical protein